VQLSVFDLRSCLLQDAKQALPAKQTKAKHATPDGTNDSDADDSEDALEVGEDFSDDDDDGALAEEAAAHGAHDLEELRMQLDEPHDDRNQARAQHEGGAAAAADPDTVASARNRAFKGRAWDTHPRVFDSLCAAASWRSIIAEAHTAAAQGVGQRRPAAALARPKRLVCAQHPLARRAHARRGAPRI
jgi:hypothetical protein